MGAPSPDWLKDETRRELNTLHQSGSISKEAYQHCIDVLDHEWGHPQNPASTAGGAPDQIFVELDNHLRELVGQHALSEGALGSIYICISQERAGKPVVGTPVPPAPGAPAPPPQAAKKGHHWHTSNAGGKAANAGKLVMGWAGRGFGFTLGADAANSLWHGVFN